MEEREVKIFISGQEPQRVIIIDDGEDFKNGDGRIPNHDKVEIIYIADK